MSAASKRQRSIQAEQARLDEALTQMPDAFLDCRDYGHSWFSWNVTAVLGGWEHWLKCSRCEAVRKRFLNRHGSQQSNRYEYADGYQLHGHGRLTGSDRDDLRLVHLARMIGTRGEQ